MKRLKKGDTVLMKNGRDAGLSGKIMTVLSKDNKIVVDKLNICKKHMRKTRDNPQGGVIDKPMPFLASKAMLVCPSCNKPTRPNYRILGQGEKVRVCKKCKEVIDK